MTEREFIELLPSLDKNGTVTIKIEDSSVNPKQKPIIGKLLLESLGGNASENNEILYLVNNGRNILETNVPVFAFYKSNETNELCYSSFALNMFNEPVYTLLPSYDVNDFSNLGVKKSKDISYITNLLNKKCDDFALYNLVKLYLKSPSLLTWMLSLMDKSEKIKYSLFMYIYDFYSLHHNLVSLLKKNILEYKTMDEIESLRNDILVIKQNRVVFSLIKSFNTLQRKILSEHAMKQGFTYNEKVIFFKLNRLDKEILTNIINKCSPIDDYDDIMNCLRISVKSSYSWDYDDFMDYCQNKENNSLSFDVVYADKKKKLVIVEVYNFKTMEVLGSKSSWCISRYESSWNEYVIQGKKDPKRNMHQYIFFDFNKQAMESRSMIAFTTNYNNTKFIHAHIMDNTNYIAPKSMSMIIYDGEDYGKDTIYIHSIFSKYGLSLGKIFHSFLIPKFEWNIESFLSFLLKNGIKKFQTNIDKKVCLVPAQRLNNDYIFNQIFENVSFVNDNDPNESTMFNMPKFLFIDFNKPVTDTDSVLLLTCVKSVVGYDYIINTENYNGIYTDTDIYGILNKYQLTDGILKAKDYTELDLLFYYLSRNMRKEFFDLLRECDENVFEQMTTYKIDHNILSSFMLILLNHNDDELIKKVLTKENIYKLANNICITKSYTAVINSVSNSIFLSPNEKVNNDTLYDVVSILFEVGNEQLKNDKKFYSRNDLIIRYYISFLLKDKKEYRFYKLVDDYKLYDLPVGWIIPKGSELIPINIFNWMLNKTKFKALSDLVQLEGETGVKLCEINSITKYILENYCNAEERALINLKFPYHLASKETAIKMKNIFEEIKGKKAIYNKTKKFDGIS